MTAAAVIPYIGWAIAAAAVLSSFIGSDKTPAVGGNALTKIGNEGTVSADTDEIREKFYGDDRGYKGPSAGLTMGLSALGDQIAATAKLYGGNAEGLSIYGQTAQSPDGQGASGGTALYNKDGTQIFGSSFEGKNEELEANVALSMKRALLGGLKAADLAPEFAKVFEGYGDNLGTLSEEQIASITAALEAVRSMNTMFDGLSITFPELEKLGWEARTALTGFSGGLEALTSNIGSYYETYYTESERMGNTLASMTETFKGLSLEVPGTKDEFKALVESLDLTTEAGQKAYATLLGMNQTFAGWADYAAAQAQAVIDKAKEAADAQLKIVDTMKSAYADFLVSLQGDIDSARGDVQEAYSRETSALEATISATRSYIKSLADLRSSLLLGDLSTLSPEQKYAQGRSDLDALIAKADGGDAEAQAAVPQAIQQFLELSRSYNASTEAYQRDFAQYLDTAERMRTTAASQLDIQQSQLSRLAEMVAGVLTVNTSVLSLKDALASFAAAAAAKAAAPATAPGTPGGLSAIEQAVNAAYLASDGRNADAGGLKFWSDAIANGADQAAILAEIAAINSATKYSGAYADGGYAAAGLALVGERGPEVVDFRSPGRVYTSNELARVVGGGSGGNAEVVAELRATRQELAEQRRENARLMSTLINLTSATSQQSSREMAEQTTALRNRNSTLIPA